MLRELLQEALDDLDLGRAPDSEWRRQARAAIEAARAPRLETEEEERVWASLLGHALRVVARRGFPYGATDEMLAAEAGRLADALFAECRRRDR